MTAQRQWRHNLRAYAASVLRGQEDERRRIAGELHDDTVQTAIQLCRQLDALGQPPASSTALEQGIRGARATAEGLIDGLHIIIRNLRPPVLDDLGLVAALGQMARGFEARTGVPARFAAPSDAPRLGADHETCVYRIVQEALSNVERHAHAREVRLEVRLAEHLLSVAVCDDGVGFVPASRQALLRNEALGLLGMYERAELSGSTLAIRSAPGKGTRVEIACPF